MGKIFFQNAKEAMNTLKSSFKKLRIVSKLAEKIYSFNMAARKADIKKTGHTRNEYGQFTRKYNKICLFQYKTAKHEVQFKKIQFIRMTAKALDGYDKHNEDRYTTFKLSNILGKLKFTKELINK